MLLVAVAVVLAVEMKSLLLGESATAEQVRAISRRSWSATPAWTGVIHLRTHAPGPEELLVAAKIAVAAKDYGPEIAARHRRGRAPGAGAVAGPTAAALPRAGHRPRRPPAGELGAHGRSPAGERGRR